MTSPLIIQSTANSVVVLFESKDTGLPLAGVSFSAVTAAIKKAGAAVFSAFTLTGSNFTDIGNGFYEIDLSTSDTNTLGLLYLSFSGTTIKTTLFSATVVVAASASPTPGPAFTPATTTIFGYVYDSSGVPVASSSVVARIVQQPYLVHPTTDSIIISSEFLTTVTDSTGFFTINLITGATVEFVIADANYRRTIQVPASTANLADIP